jgi:hypothetical protein
MLGNSSVAERLAASQVGLNSMGLVNSIILHTDSHEFIFSLTL